MCNISNKNTYVCTTIATTFRGTNLIYWKILLLKRINFYLTPKNPNIIFL